MSQDISEDYERKKNHFDAIQQMANVGAWEVDLVSGSLYWSSQTYKIHETSPAQYTPTLESAINFYAPEWVPVITEAVEKAIASGEGFDLELELITAKNNRIWVHSYCTVVKENDVVVKLFGAFQNINEIKKTRTELERSEFMFRSQFDLGKTGLALTSIDKGWIKVNKALTEITGYSEEELFGMTWAELTHPDDLQVDIAYFERLIAGKIENYNMDKRYIRKDGSIVYVHIAVSCYRKNDAVEFFIASIQDITERKLSEKRIKKLAHYDSLTGLPNRVLAQSRFEHAVSSLGRKNKMICVMFLDLDEFKTINDSLGHSAGDEFLVEIANRLTSIVRKSDTICRQGGDEFLVILESINEEKQILVIAEKILKQVIAPVSVNDISVSTSVSIGIAIAPYDGDDFENISKHADMAMYQAKNSGRNAYSFYNKELELKAETRIQLLSDLRVAIKEKCFELYYQPKIDLATNKITGAEALVRWNHPKRGIISPIEFIPLAESSGLIIELGTWILEEACRNCSDWQANGLKSLSVAVNVSAIQFKRSDFFASVKSALDSAQLPAHFLELELTESLLIADSKKLTTLFAELNKLGTKLSIDDFGTGYSNLGYLKKIKVDALKIDRSFVSKLLTNEQDEAIVEAILQMAQRLKIQVIAEGVEDQLTSHKLSSLNCDFAQGFYWSKPVPFNDFVQFVEKYNS